MMVDKQDHHLSVLRDYLFQLYKDQSLCDVSFITKRGTTILAHKLVVAAFSTAVRAEVERWRDLPQVSIVVDCEDAVLHKILEFVYTGMVDMKTELLSPLYHASCGLDILTLQNYIKENYQYPSRSKTNSNTNNSQNKNAPSKYSVNQASLQVSPEKKQSIIHDSSLQSKAAQKTKYSVAHASSHLNEKQPVTRVTDHSSCTMEISSDQSDQIRLRDRSKVKSSKQEGDEDFVWSDVEPCDFSECDDSDKDATWDSTMEDRAKSSKRKQELTLEKQFQQAYVRLERIDAPKDRSTQVVPKDRITQVKSLVYNTPNKKPAATGKAEDNVTSKTKKYTRKNMTRLANQTQRKMLSHTRKPSLTISQQSICKVKLSRKKCYKKRSLVWTASKLVRLYKTKFSCIEINRRGYSCKSCKFWSRFASVVKLHAGKHKGKVSRCKQKPKRKTCGSLERKAKMRKIERIKKKISKLECFLCDRKYKMIRGLSNHLIEQHNYSAVKAQKLTGYPKYFVIQTNEKPVCSECSLQFDTLYELRAHCRKVHKKIRMDPDIPCTQDGCHMKFKNIGSLKAHLMKTHEVEDAKNLSFRQKDPRLPKQSKDLKMAAKINQRYQTQKRITQTLTVERISTVKENQIGGENVITKKKNGKYKIFHPSKIYRCSQCTKPTTCRHSMIHKNHKEIGHKKTFVSKQFMSRVIVKKCLNPHYPPVKDYSNMDSSVINLTSQNLRNLRFSNVQPSGLENQLPNESNLIESDKTINNIQTIFQESNTSSDSSRNIKSAAMTAMSDTLQQDVVLNPVNTKLKGDLTDVNIKRKLSSFLCWKCGSTFSHYSTLCLHFKKNHARYQLRQRQIISRIQKHVDTRKTLFSRKTFEFDKNNDIPQKPICSQCQKTFSNVRNLASHLRSVHKYTFEKARETTGYPSSNYIEKKITCFVCGLKYSHIRSLALHLRNSHKYTFEQAREATGYPSFSTKNNVGRKETECEKCSKKFAMLKDYKIHFREVHGVSCDYCSQKFTNKLSLKRHGLQEHPDHEEEFSNMKVKMASTNENEDMETEPIVYNCENCEFVTHSLSLMTTHVIDFHPEVEYHCTFCGYLFRHKMSLENHILKSHERVKKLPCAYCNRRFDKKMALRIHQCRVHDIPHPWVKKYECDVPGCRKVSYSNSEHNQHKKTHETVTDKNFSCTQCDFVCPTRHRLLKHVKSIHLKLRPHLCESCGKSFTTEQHMKVHIKQQHTNEWFQLQCEYCTFQCGIKHQLQTHMWHQHNIRMADDNRTYYQCDQCSYQTPRKHKFRDHVNGHNDVRNYACDKCDAKFVTASTLRTHQIWKHSTAKEDKVCSHCGYKTKTSNKLNEHIRVQHQLKGIKPYRCPYCDFTCATGGNCRKHIMGKHKGKPVQYERDQALLEIAKMARKAGNTSELVVQVQDIVEPQNFEPMLPSETFLNM